MKNIRRWAGRQMGTCQIDVKKSSPVYAGPLQFTWENERTNLHA